MNKLYEWSLAFILSLTFMSFYWWGTSSALIGFYIPAVIQSLVLLLLINLIYKKKLRKKGAFFLLSLIFLGFLVIIFTLLRYKTILPRTFLMNQRILLWIITSILITFFLMRGFSLKKSLIKSVILWFILCTSTLGILVIFGQETLFLIDILAADGDESNVSIVKDGVEGVNQLRFVIPGINSNTVAIQCAIAIAILPFIKSKYFKVVLFLIFVITGFLTYSRMFFVFLGVFILAWTYYNKTIIPIIISLLSLPIILYLNPVIYYRFLNTIDSILGSNFSYGLTESSSDRSILLYDSFLWLRQNPFGGNIELMDQIAPGAAGEHLLYIFLANINGVFFGLIFFLISLYLFIRTFKIKYKDKSIKISLISLSTIVFISGFVAPSFYIQLIWWPIIYFYDE